MAIVTTRAAAKLNLALAVDEARADGLHPISSWMISIDLADDLTVWRLPEDRLSRYAILWHDEACRPSDIDWSITKDLAVRAHRALEVQAGRPLPVQMKLQKRIPVAAGLGGGSADAAAMLRAVRDLFELPLSDADLMEVARTLGSDVPFLVGGGSAIVEGTGESVRSSRALPPLHAALVLPPCACPTREVYRRFDELPRPTFRPDAVERLARVPDDGGAPSAPAPDALFNDLTRAACRVAPQLQTLISAVGELAERPAHLTGSGSAFFVICDDELHAEHLAAAITQKLELAALPIRATHPAPIERHETLSPGERIS